MTGETIDDSPGGYYVFRDIKADHRAFRDEFAQSQGKRRPAVLTDGAKVTPIKQRRIYRQPKEPIDAPEGSLWIVVSEQVLVEAVHRAYMEGDIHWLELEEDLEEVMWRGQEPKNTSLSKHALDVAGRPLLGMGNTESR